MATRPELDVNVKRISARTVNFPGAGESVDPGGVISASSILTQDELDNLVGTGRTKPYQLYTPWGASEGSSASQHSMKSRFIEKTPQFMLCADQLGEFSSRERKTRALEAKYISPNSRNLIGWQFFDIDRVGAADLYDEANVAVPNVIVENTANGHAHYGYALEVPVSTGPKSRKRPMDLLTGIRSGMTRRLGADPHFTYGLSKNPLHGDWRTTWLITKPYGLNDMAVFLDTEEMQPLRRSVDPSEFAERGRNCSLTWDIGKYAIRIGWQMRNAGASQAMFLREVERQACILNATFADPLGPGEVHSIARSAAKWAWARSTQEKFSEIQSKRAQIRRIRNERILAEVPGWQTMAAGQIAEIINRSKRTARRYKATPRAEYEANSAERAAPWKALGISRRTYYRREAAGEAPRPGKAGDGQIVAFA
jgi:hypothetical protein